MCIMKGFGREQCQWWESNLTSVTYLKKSVTSVGFLNFSDIVMSSLEIHTFYLKIWCVLVLCTLLSYWMFSEEQYFCQKLYFSPLQKCVLKNVFLNGIKSHNLFLERILMACWTILHGNNTESPCYHKQLFNACDLRHQSELITLCLCYNRSKKLQINISSLHHKSK